MALNYPARIGGHGVAGGFVRSNVLLCGGPATTVDAVLHLRPVRSSKWLEHSLRGDFAKPRIPWFGKYAIEGCELQDHLSDAEDAHYGGTVKCCRYVGHK